jgi:acetylornithine/N-succinyldiaminopimelate aminotransferase
MNNHLMNTYAPLPVSFVRGDGAWLWDDHGTRYLDAISGLGVCALGHSHPGVTATIADQAATLIHTSNLAKIPWQEELAEKLCRITAMDRAFIANSGTEAIECALKIARLTGHNAGQDNPGIIVMENSFHGRTLAALSATGSRKAQAGFEPLMTGFVRVPYGDTGAVAQIAAHPNSVTAVLVEPIQGEAGIVVPAKSYLTELRELCDQQGWLLILDEIQSGLCRTGSWYAHQHDGITADVVTTAKALANGLPIAACIANGEAADVFSPGMHGSTFGGNPLCSRTACKVLDIMADENIAERAAAMGASIIGALKDRLAGNNAVTDIRGRGLMIGIEINAEAGHLKDHALERGLLINITGKNVLRLLPPLIIDQDQADQIVDTVCDLITAL